MLVDILINLVWEQGVTYDPGDSEQWDHDTIAALWKNVATEIKCKGELKFLYLLVPYKSRSYMYCTEP